MLVVVNQPHINNFTIQGTISDKDLRFLKNHFGESLTVKYDDDLVDFHDTDWFKEVEPELTLYRILLPMPAVYSMYVIFSSHCQLSV